MTSLKIEDTSALIPVLSVFARTKRRMLGHLAAHRAHNRGSEQPSVGTVVLLLFLLLFFVSGYLRDLGM